MKRSATGIEACILSVFGEPHDVMEDTWHFRILAFCF